MRLDDMPESSNIDDRRGEGGFGGGGGGFGIPIGSGGLGQLFIHGFQIDNPDSTMRTPTMMMLV